MRNSLDGEAYASRANAGFQDTPLKYTQAYCLFCRTGQEISVVRELNAWLGVVAIYAERDKIEFRNGRWEKLRKPLLKGYVFLYVQSSLNITLINRVNGVIGVLAYHDGQCELLGPDRAFADWIWAQDGTVSVSKVIHEGDHVEIIDGPLKSLKGAIVRIDKRKRIAKVDLSLVGSAMQIWLSFDYLD